MTDKQRELKRERDRRYRERKRETKREESPRSTRNEQLSSGDSERIDRRHVIDIIRTEIRLRHRLQAAHEMAALEAKVNRRLEDGSVCSFRFVLESFADVEDFANASRRELWEAAGLDASGKDFTEYNGEQPNKGRAE